MRNTINKFIFFVECKDVRNKFLMETLIKDGYEVYPLTQPLIKSKKTLFYIFSPATIVNLELLKTLQDNSIVLAFRHDKSIEASLLLRNIKLICIQDDEVFAHKNAILTAEGTISLIISNTEKALFSSKILVLGYGRVGKAVCNLLHPLTNVYTTVTSTMEEGIANIFMQDRYFKLAELKNNIQDFDVIVNTIPANILTHSMLDKCKAFILDLASLPGGLDFEYAKEKNIKFLHALGIPAKFAPIDAANFIYIKVKEILKTKEIV